MAFVGNECHQKSVTDCILLSITFTRKAVNIENCVGKKKYKLQIQRFLPWKQAASEMTHCNPVHFRQKYFRLNLKSWFKTSITSIHC